MLLENYIYVYIYIYIYIYIFANLNQFRPSDFLKQSLFHVYLHS